MESKLNVQIDNFNKILKARRNYKKTPKERFTEPYCRVRLESLESLWSDFTSTHQFLIETYGAKLNGNEYIDKDFYDQAEEVYIEYKTELATMISEFELKKSKSDNLIQNIQSNANCKVSQMELPKIKIPTFSGKYTEWVTFRDLFLSLIHNNLNLDKVQKLHYLKSFLTGEAEQLLRQVPICEANYDHCWKQLNDRYNNKRFLSHFIIKRLLSQRNIAIESAGSLKELMDTTNDCLSGLSNLGVDVKNWDILIIHILTLKLDAESKKQWEFTITNSNSSEELPTFQQFNNFLTNRYRALEFLDNKSYKQQQYSQQSVNNAPKLHSLHVSNNVFCVFCSEAHRLSACKKFAKATVDQRRDFVKSKNMCFNCLGNNHGAKVCQSNIKCKICYRRHHILLHPQDTDSHETTLFSTGQDVNKISTGIKPGPTQAGEQAESSANSTSLVSCFSTGKNYKQVLLATALVNAESKNGNKQVVRVLLDQGSQANFVTEAVVQSLKLNKIPVKGKISGLGGSQDLISKSIVNVNIRSRFKPHDVITVKAHVLKSITTLIPSRRVEMLDWPELEDINLADPKYYQPDKIDILLGAGAYSEVIREGIKRGPNLSLIAQSTSLGWILSGEVDSLAESKAGVLSLHCYMQEDEQLKKFWELESDMTLNKTQMFTEEEQRCEELFMRTTIRDETGRYIVRLPFKDQDPDCKRGGSREIAEKRLKGLENRLKTNVKLAETYKEVIEEYLQLDHAKEVSQPDGKRNEAVYLPHHAVVRMDRDTTKVRVVFNASSAGKNGVTLNDTLMVGPTIQTELRHLVMKWRQHKICLGADIVKMYRQVKVHQDDADFQRFLWRSDPTEEIKDYRLERLTFGTACAPFLAVRTLNQVAQDHHEDYPIAAERVPKEFYVDDLMSGCETVEEGMVIYEQMNGLLNKGGFKLQKWITNSEELLRKIGEKNTKDIKEGLNIKIDKIIKILGLTWERKEDHFRYVVNLTELEHPVTKRKIIADISRLFDPLGWITPCIIIAKAMIQKLWLMGIQWDECVTNDVLKEWCTYRTELLKLPQVSVPRWIHVNSNNVSTELHGFCDASKIAYAAVLYIRVIDSEGIIHVSLVAAKSKVAPIKQVSIPRLELCGAVLLTRLLLEVAKVLQVDQDKIHAWTDSTIVLSWLNSLPNKWKVFVANRVSEILTSLNPSQWSHVASKQNPADCASRGMLTSELVNNTLWFKGPEFLSAKDIKYDKPQDLTTDLEAVVVHHTISDEIDIWERFSTLNRLIRVVAYCRRFLALIKQKAVRKQNEYLETKELQEAMELCIRKCQAQHFKEEVQQLVTNKEISKKSILKSLNPFIDDKTILRVGGRLEESQFEKERKHPIIMPKKSHLTSLLIHDAHRMTLHGGTQLTLNYLNNKYFILGAKQVIKSHIRKCVTCVKNAGLTQNPLMGQLPPARVTPARAFQNSGVDFAGPIQIRTTKGRGQRSYKGYICLFVCMSTRAVHIEAVSDLTSQGFLQCFKRFVARRGICKEIWSDNGTNFVGAASELKKLFTKERGSILPEIAETLATNGTSWHFIPPHAPNFGGLWEAGVKSVKFHLKRVVGNSTLSYEELATVLCQIEACLNSRPLYRVGNESDNTEVLTPAHFLVGESLVTAPDHSYETSNIGSLKRWQYTQRMLQEFWRKWSHEYLSQFFRRYRWSSQTSQPHLNDVVLIKEDNLPPCRWLYGVVVEEHPGCDGITRVVSIKTKNSIIKRPVSKLCVLPVTD